MKPQENIKKIKQDLIRAKSLKKTSENSLNILKLIKLNQDSANIIFRELYEALRQDLESIGYFKGYKFRSHEAITIFLKEILKEEKIAFLFDKYRKLRNNLNYYGKPIHLETVKESTTEIPKIIKYLSRYRK
ncbi:hypothetical protein KAJ87_03670 [Candidatus Pacearchaeota archaeon]|nr:hypothetical protein [Candidatus Pacearchaeota archaeon]